MKNNSFKILITIILTALITFAVTYLFIYGRISKEPDGAVSTSKALKDDSYRTKLAQIRQLIDSEYLGEVDENALRDSTLKGYVDGLNDVYTEYYTAEEMKELLSDMESSYIGVGVYITLDTEYNLVKIYGFLEGSPAKEAGLEVGDYIVGVNGEELSGDDFENASKRIMGEEGTNVTLTIAKKGQSGTKDYTITRKRIEVKSISYQVLDNNIGYIYVSTFDKEKVSEEFNTAIIDLKTKGITSLIVDLRNNGGGILTECASMADIFVDAGTEMIHQKDKKGNDDITYAKLPKSADMNVVILVNQYSASASELFTGIVRDNSNKCVVVGTQTYGKGVVQSLRSFPDGSGIKMTTDEYFTTGQYTINGVGIIPDVKVDDYQYTGSLDKEKDTQFKKAVEILKDGDMSKFRNEKRQDVEGYKKANTNTVSE